MLISLIVPCYNEEEAMPLFYQEAARVAAQMEKSHGAEFEIIFVDDGSKDGTLRVARELHDADPRVRYVSFSRNFGKEAGIYAGLKAAKGDYVATLDADLQDPPALLPDMLDALLTGDYDCAATRRTTREGEPPVRSWFARMFYRIINKMSDTEIVDGARDFRLMSRRMVDAVLEMSEYNRFSKGIFSWVGFKTKWFAYQNVERVAGQTKWNFWSLFKYSIEGIVGFSTQPLVMAALAGVIYSLLLAFASINLKADQTIGGTALNMLATAIAMILAKNFNGSTSAKISYTNKPFLFSIGGLELSIFIPLGIVLLVVSYIVMYKTRFGLRLRACGEHPQAADSVGINVYRMRYAGVLISGFLGGVGGLAYVIPSVQTWNFEVGVAGTGFLALAVMIFGQWKPFNIFGAAMFFAVFKSLANIADSTVLAQLGWSSNIYNMMPFIASMVILAFTSKNSQAPKAEGIPYDKGSR